MTNRYWALAAVLLLPAVATAADSEPQATQEPGLPPAVAALLQLAAGDRGAADDAFLLQLQKQGALQAGFQAVPLRPAPPEKTFRDARPTCDLDGDGVTDLITNDLDLDSPPANQPAPSQVRAISGADGTTLWAVDNLYTREIQSPPGVPMARLGEPFPGGGKNVHPTTDVNGDGACDTLAWGYEDDTSFTVPIVGTPSFSTFFADVRLISGRDGSDIWSARLDGSSASADVPPIFFDLTSTSRVVNFPTGFLPYHSPSGPKVLVKTTDMTFVHTEDPFGLTGVELIPDRQGFLKEPFRMDAVGIDEHYTLLDAATGETLWRRDILTPADARFTNVTWITGVADLAGDQEPEILLDQFVITNPRGSEADHPVTGQTLFRYGKGMRMMALRGELDAAGEPLWSTNVLEPLVVAANPGVEENFEVLVWTRGLIGPDGDGDGHPDPLASYVVQEEALGSTINGAFRTHFAALSGADGAIRWDVRQQGWGFAAPASDGGPHGALIAMGLVDVPTDNQPTGVRFPPKAVRLGVLAASDGSSLWGYERAFAQNSYLSYNLALSQYETTLAPYDWDGDGVLDLVTPAQYEPVTGRTQVLLATATHQYEIRSGADGSVLQTLTAWGPTGRVVACPGADDQITIVAGHGRRMELQRFDARIGERLWSRPIHNDAAPRAAGAGVDVSGVGATCLDAPEGRTLYSVNIQAFSALRRHEVVAILGSLDGTGGTLWQTPAVRGAAEPDERLLQASIRATSDTQPPPLVPALLVGAALGTAAGVATVVLRRRSLRVLGAAIILLVVVPGVAPALGPLDQLAPADALLPPGPELAPDPAADAPGAAAAGAPGDGPTPADHVLAATRHLARAGLIRTDPDPWLDNAETMAFTYPTRDLDGDRIADVVVDHYCDDWSACVYYPDVTEDPVTWLLVWPCGGSHKVYGLSGANRSVLWEVDLTFPTVFPACAGAFVLGTAPLSDGRTGVLVYRIEASGFWWHTAMAHDLTMLDAATGEPVWTHHEDGLYSSDILTYELAETYVVNPILRLPDAGGADVGLSDTRPALFLEGVGWAFSGASSWILPVGQAGLGRTDLLDQYAPKEWAARLDLDTGEVVWRTDTFLPEPGRSVYPTAIEGPRYDNFWWGQGVTSPRYWASAPCCLDLTGDGEPEMVFRVLEWAALPNANTDGPYNYDSRLVVRDGSTGEVLVDRYATRNFKTEDGPNRDFAWTLLGTGIDMPNYHLRLVPVGDADGDGDADLLQHEEFGRANYTHVVTLLAGPDGEPAWNVTTPRDLETLLVGDADGDGGNDLLVVDWWGYEQGQERDDDYNATGATLLRMVSGADGSTLWQATTYAAPIDVVAAFDAWHRNGLLDLDADGVADFFLDDPEILADQSVIHRLTFISGRDATPIRQIRVAGTFAIPTRIADVDGDGRDEYAVVSGDVNDLWMTAYDGATGAAEWSRRLLAVPVSGYAEAVPQLRVIHLPSAGPGHGLLALDFQLDLRLSSTFTCICWGGDTPEVGEVTRFYWTTTGQILAINATDGTALWAAPSLPSDDATLAVLGDTPGTQMYLEVLEEASAGPLARAGGALPVAASGGAGFAGAFLGALGVGTAVTRRARRDEEVPDLD